MYVIGAMFYWNVQIRNKIIIIKAKFLLPHACVNLADFGYRVLGSSVLSFSKV
jgi:hypothetical protein